MFLKEEVKEKLLKFRINGVFLERSYCRGGSRILVLFRRLRGVEGVLESIFLIKFLVKGIENICF